MMLLVAVFSIIFSFSKVSLENVYNIGFLADTLDALHKEPLPAPLENPPAILKSVYATGWSAGSKSYLAYLQSVFKTTQVNAVIIDVKDASGIVSYKTGAELPKKYKAYYPKISNVDALIKSFHNQGIYVIGRIVVFEDVALATNRPDLAVFDKSKTQDKSNPVTWQTKSGLLWLDPASEEVWDYNISVAKDALKHGFDEINFDYIRFPTDGNLDNMGFPVWDRKIPRHLVIKSFFQKIRESLMDAKISVDLFGQTTTNNDDMGVGQLFEDSLSYFDYVCPMVYPSHYASGFLGYQNPAEHPYDMVKYAVDGAVFRQKVYEKLQKANNTNDNTSLPSSAKATEGKTKIRPWIQDFNLGALYNIDMVKQEIKAVEDSTGNDFSGFMLWNPRNFYTTGAVALTAAN